MAISPNGLRINAEELRILDFGDLSEAFAAVGSELAHPAHILTIQNQTDVDIYWSWHEPLIQGFLPANGGHLILDITTNKKWEQGMYLARGITVSAAAVPGQAAPTTGSVYVTAFYGVIV